MRARMISARLKTLPLLPRMSVARRSRWRICRSKSTTDTLDQVSLWTGGRPRLLFFSRLLGPRTGRLAVVAIRIRSPDYSGELLVAQTEQFRNSVILDTMPLKLPKQPKRIGRP